MKDSNNQTSNKDIKNDQGNDNLARIKINNLLNPAPPNSYTSTESYLQILMNKKSQER
jgi:hypothetical protein